MSALHPDKRKVTHNLSELGGKSSSKGLGHGGSKQRTQVSHSWGAQTPGPRQLWGNEWVCV